MVKPPPSRLRVISVIISVLCACSSLFAEQSDLVLTGREATSVQLAVSDFLQHRYSKSGDLTRYTVRVARVRKQLEITFVPDTDPRGPYPGGGTAYGPEVTYYVSLSPPRILNHLFAQ
jgi:hypothetical protein